MMTLHDPKRYTSPSRNACTLSADLSGMAFASGQRDKYSVATTIYLLSLIHI